MGLSWLLMWGGMPVPALASMVEEQPTADDALVEHISAADDQDGAGLALNEQSVDEGITANDVNDDDDALVPELVVQDQLEDDTLEQEPIDEGDDPSSDDTSVEEQLSELPPLEEQSDSVVTMPSPSMTLTTQSAADSETTTFNGEVIKGVVQSPYALSNEQLLNGYVQELIDQTLPASKRDGMMLSTQSAGDAFGTSNMGKVYNALKTEIAKVASGTRTNTIFTFAPSFLTNGEATWTPSDLGVANFSTSANKTKALSTVMKTKLGIDEGKIMNALLADCPYELYWFDKTAGYAFQSFSFSITDSKLKLSGSMKFTLYVSKDYKSSASNTTTDASRIRTAEAALTKAQSVANGASGKTGKELLKYFNDKICELVDYDFDTPRTSAYGNPWQLINVFDGNASTKCLCEGYAKAFKYLCDLKKVECLTVTGTMSGGTGAGPHMWNVVTMNNKNYVVDVTNCDKGTVGAPVNPDENPFLFMRYYQSGSYADGYYINANGKNIKYTYDASTKNLYGQTLLQITQGTQISSKAATLAAKTYNGKKQTDGLTISGLKEGTDYTVKWPSGCIKAGTYTVTVIGIGEYAGTKSVKLTINKATPTITINAPSVVKNYGDAAFYVGAKKSGGDGAIKYKTSNASVASVNSSGKVTLKGSGTATVTAYLNASTNFNAVSKAMTVTVNKAANPLKLTVKKAVKSVSYKPTTTASAGTNVKKKNAQGTVTYKNVSADATAKGFTVNAKTGSVTLPAGTNGGNYKVRIEATAAGNAKYMAGSQTAEYTIQVKPITSKLKVKTQSLKYTEGQLSSDMTVRPLTVTNPANNTTYTRLSGKAGLSLNSDGSVKISRGLKKGSYTMRVKVTAPATSNYKTKSKTVTVRVRVTK